MKSSSRFAAAMAVAGVFQVAACVRPPAPAKTVAAIPDAPGLKASCLDANGNAVSAEKGMPLPVTLSVDAEKMLFSSVDGRTVKGELNRHACVFFLEKDVTANVLDMACVPRDNRTHLTTLSGSTAGKINADIFSGEKRHAGIDTWLAVLGNTEMTYQWIDENGKPRVTGDSSAEDGEPLDTSIRIETEMDCTITGRTRTAPVSNPALVPS